MVCSGLTVCPVPALPTEAEAASATCPSPERRPPVRLAREHPRSTAKTLSLVGGRANAILRPAALHGHTRFARRTGSGQAELDL